MSESPDSSTDSEPPDGSADPSRRRVLELVAGTTVGAGLAGRFLDGSVLDGALGRDRTRIVYGVARATPGDPSSLEKRTTTVPTEWHDRLAAAVGLQRRLARRSVSGSAAISVVPGDYDRPTPELRLAVSNDGVRRTLHETLAAVDAAVDVRTTAVETDRRRPDGPDDRSESPELPDGSPVPGGFSCSAVGNTGTLAPALYDPERDRRLLATAGHLYGEVADADTDPRGLPLYLGDEADETAEIGRVEQLYPNEDLVCARPTGDAVPDFAIGGGESRTVIGQFTMAGLADLKARGEPLEKVGAFSGHTSGPIEAVNGTTCYYGDVCKTGQLKWGDETSMTDGDSGSVNYHADPDHPDEYVMVGGLNNARTWWPGADYTWGTAAYHVTEQYGLRF